MARTFDNSGTHSLIRTPAPATGTPVTLAVWVNPSSTTTVSAALSIGTAFGDYIIIFHNASNFVGGQYAMASGPASAAASITTPNMVIGTWYHLCAVFTSSTVNSAYLNGANLVTNSGHTAVTPATLVRATIGANQGGGFGEFSGTVAFPAIWNIALSSADVLELATGLSPRMKHPESLLCYARLDGNSPETDMVSSITWTLTGVPTVADNPRLYNP